MGGCVSRVPCYAKDPIRNERFVAIGRPEFAGSFWETERSPMADKPLLITTKPTISFSLLVLVFNYQPIVVCYASAPGGEYVQSLATIFLHSVSSSELWRFEKVCYGVLARIFHFTNYDRGFFRKETWIRVHVFSLCLQGWKLVHTATVNCKQAVFFFASPDFEDVIIIACNLTPSTKGMVNRRRR